MVVNAGQKQEIMAGMICFDLDKMQTFELTKSVKEYHPMIISINYTDQGQ